MREEKIASTLRASLVVLALIAILVPWGEEDTPHLALELTAGLAGVLVFLVSLRGRRGAGPLAKFLGLAWLAAGTMDILHALFSVDWIVAPESAPDHFIPGSWTASRTVLGTLLLIALVFRGPLGRSGRWTAIVGILTTVSLAILCLLFFALTPLPSFILDDFPVKRPWELAPLLLYLVSFLELGRERTGNVLRMSLEAAIAAQVAMLFAGSLFDGLFYAAHALKVASYILAAAALWKGHMVFVAEKRPLWARPVLSWTCAAILLTGALGVWWKMRAGEEVRMWAAVEAELRRAGDRITAQLGTETLAFVRMARRWETRGRPERSDAAGYLAHMPALRALAWSDQGGRVRWCVPAERESAVRSSLADVRGSAPSAPADLPSGRNETRRPAAFVHSDRGYLILVPLEGELAGGHLVADLAVERWLRDALLDLLATGLSLTVLDGESTVYSSGGHGSHGPSKERGAALSVRNLHWVIRASPTPAYVAGARSPLPGAALSIGCAFAILSFFVVRLTQAGHERSRALQESHAELVRAREELERRVEERTRDLSRANRTLQKEVDRRQRAQKQVDERNRELEALLHVASHDLREPLRAIENFSAMVADSYAERLDERGRDLLRRIVRAAARMSQLLDDVLALSRVRRIERPEAEIESTEVVEDALARLAAPIQQKEARVHVAPGLPRLRADRTWATQAVYNLLSNALKFTPEGVPPEIEVDIYRPGDGEAPEVGLVIRDRGPGIEARHAERIFGLFQRAVSREVAGTGAGLAIVRQVAGRHGGRAWVRRRPGGGSEFVITFGMAKEEKDAEEAEKVREREALEESGPREEVMHGSPAGRDPPR